jgi:hypothetical protein
MAKIDIEKIEKKLGIKIREVNGEYFELVKGKLLYLAADYEELLAIYEN